eukprot:4872311-Prymnesium_polylepis.1
MPTRISKFVGSCHVGGCARLGCAGGEGQPAEAAVERHVAHDSEGDVRAINDNGARNVRAAGGGRRL